jgi:hypothetical protein
MGSTNQPTAAPVPTTTRARTLAEEFTAPTTPEADLFADFVLMARPKLVPQNLLDACDDNGAAEVRRLLARAYAMGARCASRAK